jgi:hypothetical protein
VGSRSNEVIAFVHVRSEVFMAVTMKNGVFCDVTSCRSCKNRRLYFFASCVGY